MILYLWIILQIILESVPVSSSGHVALMQLYAQYFGYNGQMNEQLWMIDFLLHGPMIVILLCFFFARWWHMIIQKPIYFTSLIDRSSWKAVGKTVLFVSIADGITVAWWWFDIVPSSSLRLGFVITAILLYLTRYCKEVKKEFDGNMWYAIALGVAQSFSFLPGVSRFATTYAVGRFLSYSGSISFAVSFLVQFPLLIAAFLKGCLALIHYPEMVHQFFNYTTVILILFSTYISYVLLRCIDDIIQKNRLWLFAWYMLIPIMLTFFV